VRYFIRRDFYLARLPQYLAPPFSMYAIKHGITERVGRRCATEIVVLEVRGHLSRVTLGREAIAPVATIDGEQHQ
jgi:hypothetical protein